MSKKRRQAEQLTGLQVGVVEVVEPKSGTLKIRDLRDGNRTGRFYADEDLRKYRLCWSLLHKWKGSRIHDGYALIDPRTEKVFHFRVDGCSPPPARREIYVGRHRLVIPKRIAHKVPHESGALVALYAHPTVGHRDAAHVTWAIEKFVPLEFDRPLLIARSIQEAHFRPYLSTFVTDYLGFVEEEGSHFDLQQKKEHVVVLKAVSESEKLENLHERSQIEMENLHLGDIGFLNQSETVQTTKKVIGFLARRSTINLTGSEAKHHRLHTVSPKE